MDQTACTEKIYGDDEGRNRRMMACLLLAAEDARRLGLDEEVSKIERLLVDVMYRSAELRLPSGALHGTHG